MMPACEQEVGQAWAIAGRHGTRVRLENAPERAALRRTLVFPRQDIVTRARGAFNGDRAEAASVGAALEERDDLLRLGALLVAPRQRKPCARDRLPRCAG
jgi:hypothetical protein